MVSATVRITTRPAPERQPARSATPGMFLRGPNLMKGPACMVVKRQNLHLPSGMSCTSCIGVGMGDPVGHISHEKVVSSGPGSSPKVRAARQNASTGKS